MLIARSVPSEIGRTLVCASGEAPARETLRRGGAWVGRLGVATSLMHVMSQVALDLDSPQEGLTLTAEQAIAQGTREGRHLQEAMGWAREAEVAGEITPQLRHGLVVWREPVAHGGGL